MKAFWRRFGGVLTAFSRRFQGVFKTPSKPIQNACKTPSSQPSRSRSRLRLAAISQQVPPSSRSRLAAGPVFVSQPSRSRFHLRLAAVSQQVLPSSRSHLAAGSTFVSQPSRSRSRTYNVCTRVLTGDPFGTCFRAFLVCIVSVSGIALRFFCVL